MSILAVLSCLACTPWLAAGESSGSAGQLKWVSKGSSATNRTAQHGLSLAKPITHASVSDTRSSESEITVLRWRNPRLPQANFTPVPADTADPAPIPRPSILEQDTLVRPVSREIPVAAESDPFEDPFADRPAPPATALELPSSEVSRSSQEPAPLPTTSTFVDTQQADAQPEEQPALPLPEPDSAGTDSCQQIYNRRDCCAEEEQCQDAAAQWQRNAISKISLDITPSFRPDETDPYAEEAEREREMAKVPVRTWHDRKGNFLATGRLTNIKRGRVLILDADNQILKLPFNDLSDDDLCFLTAWWGVPSECTLGDEEFAGRNWNPMTFTWKASGNCHKPLYFEETQLERYGHTAGPLRQPVLSGAHFFLNLVTLPYQAGINPPWECRYALGYYRPGNCAPWLVPPVPLSVRGGLWQAGAVVGGIALIP